MEKEELEKYLGKSVSATVTIGGKMEGILKKNNGVMYPEDQYIIENQFADYDGYTYYFNPEIIVNIEVVDKEFKEYSKNN